MIFVLSSYNYDESQKFYFEHLNKSIEDFQLDVKLCAIQILNNLMDSNEDNFLSPYIIFDHIIPAMEKLGYTVPNMPEIFLYDITFGNEYDEEMKKHSENFFGKDLYDKAKKYNSLKEAQWENQSILDVLVKKKSK